MAAVVPPDQSPARGALLSLIGQAIPLAVGVLTLPVIIRGLGPEAFGLLALAWAALGSFGIFDLGLSRSTTKLIAEALGRGDRQTVPQIARTAVALHGVMGVGFGLVVAAALPIIAGHLFHMPAHLEREVRPTFYLLAAAIPIVVTGGAFRGILEAYRRFDLLNLIRVVAGSGNLLLPLIVVLRGGGLPAITLSLVLVRLAAWVAYVGMSVRLVGFGRQTSSLDRRTAGVLFTFGGWVMVSTILAPVLNYLDRALISSLVSLAAVGYYAPPYEMVSRLLIIPTSLAFVLFPTVSLIGPENPRRILSICERSIRMLLLMMTPTVMLIAIFAEPILQLWLGPEFARESTQVMQVLALGMLANALAYIPFTVLQGLGRPDLTAKAHLIELPIYALGAWYLTKVAGITGAAVAWSLFLVFDAALLSLIAGNQLSAPAHAIWAVAVRLRSAVVLAATFGMAVALVSLLGGAGLKLALAGVATVAFAWLAWFRVLDAGERATILAATGLHALSVKPKRP